MIVGLTSTWRQWVTSAPTMIVASTPVTSPARANACGIAKMPVPRLHLSRWTSVSRLLQY